MTPLTPPTIRFSDTNAHRPIGQSAHSGALHSGHKVCKYHYIHPYTQTINKVTSDATHNDNEYKGNWIGKIRMSEKSEILENKLQWWIMNYRKMTQTLTEFWIVPSTIIFLSTNAEQCAIMQSRQQFAWTLLLFLLRTIESECTHWTVTWSDIAIINTWNLIGR